MTERHKEVLPDGEALARHAAGWLVERAAKATGRFAICLSGGATPKRLYGLLATPPYRDRFPWDRVHWFWGDERFVPPTHPDSNFRMAYDAMLAHVPVPESQIHPVPTEGLTPHQAAMNYERELQDFYSGGSPDPDARVLDPARPLFDVTLLGIGDDGHTASLFPGNDALDERIAWVTTAIGVKPEPRITLTYRALDSSRDVVFLVTGEAKHPVLQRIEAGEPLPAARVRPVGSVHWMLDSRAATGVSS